MLDPIKRAPPHIVISGISGRWPEASNFAEFQRALFQHVDMVTVDADGSRRFKAGLYGTPAGFGKIPQLDRFDGEFFRVLPNQANRMDPQLRIAMEVTAEAILDAGINPAELRGSRTGVFYGVSSCEAETLWNSAPAAVQGITLTGSFRPVLPNRISYAFDLRGPSCAYDTACSSSIVALEAAVSAIRGGQCDAAVVVASNLILAPFYSMQLDRLSMLAKDSTPRSLDAAGTGYVRSEAVVAIFIQSVSVPWARVAVRRAYAEIVHCKTNTDGYKDTSMTYPSAAMQQRLIRETMDEAGVDPNDVGYVEVHAAGTPVGDPQEVLALSRIFCRGRRVQGVGSGTEATPLLIGSVKSNMGHAEAAAGLCGVAKLLTILQTGVIPANLHFRTPAFTMHGIRSGSIKVVAENTAWAASDGEDLSRTLLELNSFGLGGVNGHLILRPSRHSRRRQCPPCPPLVLFSGRTKEAVRKALCKVASTEESDGEGGHYLAILLNGINRMEMPGMNVRGFTITRCHRCEDTKLGEASEPVVEVASGCCSNGSPSSLYCVFNGMGAQWMGMGRDLLHAGIRPFDASILKSTAILNSMFRFDLLGRLQTVDEVVFQDPTNCFVCIAVLQMALYDTIRALGIYPEGLIGHSAGEMLCAYADDCVSREQVIAMAYWRGKVVQKYSAMTPYGYGMAVVAMRWEDKGLLPKGLHAACQNGAQSMTVSGPLTLLRPFIEEAAKSGLHAVEVQCCGVPFHSPYLAEAAEEFRAHLHRILGSDWSPQVRSDGWISTSDPNAALFSVEYAVNNFLCPVLFHDALQQIPPGSTVVEVGPSGLLRGLIKRGAHPSCSVIALQSRQGRPVPDLLVALGRVYLAGVNFDANKLCSTPEGGPAPASTPSISPLIKWDHSVSWDVPLYGANGEFRQEGVFEIDMEKDSEWAFLAGHQINGRVLFPGTGYIVLVWKHFAHMNGGGHFEDLPVAFENIKLHRVTVLSSGAGGGRNCRKRTRVSTKFKFRVSISDISGAFEVKESGVVVCDGFIRPGGDNWEVGDGDATALHQLMDACHMSSLGQDEIYRRLKWYGYEYHGLFRGIQKCNFEETEFLVAWQGNWIPFLDTFFQTKLPCFVGNETEKRLRLGTGVGHLLLDPVRFKRSAQDNTSVFVSYCYLTGTIQCCGIQAKGVTSSALASARAAPTTALRLFIDDDGGECEIVDGAHVVATDKCFVGMATVGDLTSFEWVQGPDYEELRPPGGLFVPVNVHCSGLNPKDATVARGLVEPEFFDEQQGNRALPYIVESPLGTEYSGILQVQVENDGKPRVRRVCGLHFGQALATQVLASVDLLWDMPDAWSFEEGASVPVAYCTVYHALVVRGRLQADELVLIYSSATELPLAEAAVNLALGLRAAQIVLVARGMQQEMVNKFRRAGVTVVSELVKGTYGAFDIVFCLRGVGLDDATAHVAPGGRLLLIGAGAMAQQQIPNNLELHSVSLSSAIRSTTPAGMNLRSCLRALVAQGIELGIVRPLTRRTVFPMDHIEIAFRCLGTTDFGDGDGTGVGDKVLVQVRPDVINGVPWGTTAKPRVYFDPRKLYLVAVYPRQHGGSVGLEFVEWMIGRYATRLLLVIRSEAEAEKSLWNNGSSYLTQCINMWTTQGVQISVVEEENFAKTMERNETVVGGFFNMSRSVSLSQEMEQCTQAAGGLDFFVLYEECVVGGGRDGSGHRDICERRLREGLPCKLVRYESDDGVGDADSGSLTRSLLKWMDTLLTHPTPKLCLRRVDDVGLCGVEKNGCAGTGQVVTVVGKIAEILGHVNLGRNVERYGKCGLTDLGMDSVMTMEIRHMLEVEFGVALGASQIRACTVAQIVDMCKRF